MNYRAAASRLLTAAVLLVSTATAQAENAIGGADWSVFTFGGAMSDGDMLQTANPFGVGYDNPIIGMGYQLFPGRIASVRLGFEAGVAGRFGRSPNAEFWGGVVGRHDGFMIGEHVRISPALTFGISHATRTQEGRELENERARNGNARTLFYLGPEINLTLADRPNVDIFWRLHHRSGAWGTLGGMHGGSDANVIGLRFHY